MLSTDFKKRIEMCSKFSEGSEIEDAVICLIDAARTLYGIGDTTNLQLALIAAESLIEDYIKFLRFEYKDWESYNWLDDEMFTFYTGGAKKLTEAEYTGKSVYDNN